jgi:LDH2 family malate/lactate/ureidoglycolate dehydrogenase
MLGYYSDRAAKRGVVALVMADCCPLMAPWGGMEPVLGTNPISAAFPWKPHPILIDLGSAAITQGDVDRARRADGEIAPESAVDTDGRFTTDPDAVHTLLPFGRHKGYALGLLVQLLSGPLVGAAGVPDDRRDYGLFCVAVRPDLFAPVERYETQVGALVERIKSARTMEGVEEILIPGERAFRERTRRVREGIETTEDRLRQIEAMA